MSDFEKIFFREGVILPSVKVEKLEEATGQINDLAVLPHVVFRVLELSSSSTANAQAVEQAIVVDPGFSTKILAHANSASYGLSRRVTSIKEAVMFLGFKAVRNLAMTVGTFDLFVGKTDSESLRRRGWWRHSLDTALCAKWLAGKLRIANPDDAYTVGLLHLVGKTLIDRMHPKDFDKIRTTAEQEELPIWLVERNLYGFHHGDLMESVSMKWGFPDELRMGLNYIEEPLQINELRAITALSHVIAGHATVSDAYENGIGSMFPNWSLEQTGVSIEKLPTILDEAQEAISVARMQLAS